MNGMFATPQAHSTLYLHVFKHIKHSIVFGVIVKLAHTSKPRKGNKRNANITKLSMTGSTPKRRQVRFTAAKFAYKQISGRIPLHI